MIRKPLIVKKEHVQNGEGEIEFRHILSEEELYGHGRLFAEIVIPPGGSIGKHRHVDETEPYYILQGKGVFHDADGSEHVVHPGDVCVIEVGQEHWIENRSQQPLSFIALIYNGKNILK
jgi:mannose-6-phosphate isomerase-like protein (cupin superfamily)